MTRQASNLFFSTLDTASMSGVLYVSDESIPRPVAPYRIPP
jgi:hypothetical protein